MSEAADITAPPPPSSAAMVGALGGIALLAGLLVVLVVQFTAPYIAENQRCTNKTLTATASNGLIAKAMRTACWSTCGRPETRRTFL